jgi:hypothetical protein
MDAKSLLLPALLCAAAASPSPARTDALSPCEQVQGFQSLFDGSLADFQSHFVDYKQNDEANADFDPKWKYCAEDNSICTQGQVTKTLRSREKYGDFDLRLQYRNDGDAGIFYRGLTRAATINATAVEYGILEDNTGIGRVDWAGGATAILGPDPYTYFAYATAKWNDVRIVAKGDSVEHWMNGVKVLGYRLWGPAFKAGIAAGKWAASADKAQMTPGCKCPITSGYLGFQGDHPTSWHLRNIRVTTQPQNVAPGAPSCGELGLRGSAAPQPSGYLREIAAGRLRFETAGSFASAEIVGLDGKVLAGASRADGWNSPPACEADWVC